MTELGETFRAGLDPAAPAPAGLDATLASIRESAHAAWPSLAVPDARLGAHLARLVAAEPQLIDALEQLNAADVYFSLACADNLGDALATLDRVYFAELRSPLARMGLHASAIDETLQVMRTELVAPRPGAEPRILNYGGRGHLRGWLRAVAARTGQRTVRHPERHDELDERVHAPVAGDMELAFMKKEYGELFRRAFQHALAAIPADDRLLLKQRFRHHLKVEELGAMHSVNAGTISRWVAAARERLVKATKAEMMEELGVGRADVDSILRMIHSQLEISLASQG
jgi:RNA polymerase sigma-70 factor, ECF subfamily